MRRVARGGLLVLGGGFAGQHIVRKLGQAGLTIVDPVRAPPGRWPQVDFVRGFAVALDPEWRVVRVEAGTACMAIAYAQLVVALGRSGRGVASLRPPRDARGRVRVDERLRVVGAPNIWALGDCATLPVGAPHQSAPPALAAFYDR